tara:strand:- start:101 stop:475 length:375 start_codon:yes stop_codon:yes gene_type:complete
MEITREDLKNNQSRNVVQYDTIQNTKDIARLKQDVISLISVGNNSYSQYFIGDGVKEDFDIPHPFGNNVMVQLWDNVGQLVSIGNSSLLEITKSTGSINVDFNVAIANGQTYTLTIIKTANVIM